MDETDMKMDLCRRMFKVHLEGYLISKPEVQLPIPEIYQDDLITTFCLPYCEICNVNYGKFMKTCPCYGYIKPSLIAQRRPEGCVMMKHVIRHYYENHYNYQTGEFQPPGMTPDVKFIKNYQYTYKLYREQHDMALGYFFDRIESELEDQRKSELEDQRMVFALFFNRIEADTQRYHKQHMRKLSKKRRLEEKRALLERSRSEIDGADVCTILRKHSEVLQEDPERLSTDFLKKLIGSTAQDCP